eukprot:2891570-Pleurochrysis_carterae.AAC.1
MGLLVREGVGIETRHVGFVPGEGVMIRRISVMLRVWRIVPFVTGRVATGWPHLHSIVHPHIIILPER